MPTIVVEVMPKAEILDPQGKAVAGALVRLDRSEFTSVRIGKRFELTVDGPITADLLAEARAIANDLLANTVIEDVIYVGEARGADGSQTAAEGA
ncbi:phosphoribosylformylglycinamidine synthase [Rhodoglobus vestalii]|uniref:Phosphoribosylformylglycinamidine synthase subunit PurS n=1 Tax=Rhodoglobus vestalii TaxID=193384 RepID=A0A8H2PYD3_9MICO|nr:phosphoribosylformylglycinamidine synthase subunit PurS [Rhodoglobus vestalii]TQO20244.1 phosphoribosylformylglycinamidine synthase [Rhodoglobus vestalii]